MYVVGSRVCIYTYQKSKSKMFLIDLNMEAHIIDYKLYITMVISHCFSNIETFSYSDHSHEKILRCMSIIRILCSIGR